MIGEGESVFGTRSGASRIETMAQCGDGWGDSCAQSQRSISVGAWR